MKWIYIHSEANLYTVGFYDPDGEFQGDSDHADRDAAANRCNFLNGAQQSDVVKLINIVNLSKAINPKMVESVEIESTEVGEGVNYRTNHRVLIRMQSGKEHTYVNTNSAAGAYQSYVDLKAAIREERNFVEDSRWSNGPYDDETKESEDE